MCKKLCTHKKNKSLGWCSGDKSPGEEIEVSCQKQKSDKTITDCAHPAYSPNRSL